MNYVGSNKIGYAKYQETIKNTLRFEYVVVEGDYSEVMYVSSNSLSRNLRKFCGLLNPQTEANVTLPAPRFLAQNSTRILTNVTPQLSVYDIG